jgi:hypothetical protein
MGRPLLNNIPLKFFAYYHTNAKCNKHYIITFYILALVPHEGVIRDNVVMFKKQDELW